MPAEAARIEMATRVDGVPVRVFVTGELFDGDQDDFGKVISKVDQAIVIFDSPGGDVSAGLGIGRQIRERGLTTLVPMGYECASACALAWLGGAVRYMAPKGSIGFHAAYYVHDEGPQERGAPNAVIGGYLYSLGLSDEAIVFITSAPPDSMSWLTFELAETYGIEVLPWRGPEEPISNSR
jgi:hypothetical protein